MNFQLIQNFEKLISLKKKITGEGEDGKLGHNNRITLDKPKLIEALRSKRIRDIACGSSHSAAITASGELYCWGLGEVISNMIDTGNHRYRQ